MKTYTFLRITGTDPLEQRILAWVNEGTAGDTHTIDGFFAHAILLTHDDDILRFEVTFGEEIAAEDLTDLPGTRRDLSARLLERVK